MDAVEDLVVPDDLAAAFDRHPGSAEHWDSWSASARKMILTWIVLAKKPETRAARVETTAEKAARGEKTQRSEEHTSELQSRQYLHSFPTRRSSDLWTRSRTSSSPTTSPPPSTAIPAPPSTGTRGRRRRGR